MASAPETLQNLNASDNLKRMTSAPETLQDLDAVQFADAAPPPFKIPELAPQSRPARRHDVLPFTLWAAEEQASSLQSDLESRAKALQHRADDQTVDAVIALGFLSFSLRAHSPAVPPAAMMYSPSHFGLQKSRPAPCRVTWRAEQRRFSTEQMARHTMQSPL